MQDSPFIFFLGFGFLWVLMGLGGLYLILKSNGQSLKSNPAVLIVFIPIVIAFIGALTFGAMAK
jgi:hypothetical protein